MHCQGALPRLKARRFSARGANTVGRGWSRLCGESLIRIESLMLPREKKQQDNFRLNAP